MSTFSVAPQNAFTVFQTLHGSLQAFVKTHSSQA